MVHDSMKILSLNMNIWMYSLHKILFDIFLDRKPYDNGLENVNTNVALGQDYFARRHSICDNCFTLCVGESSNNFCDFCLCQILKTCVKESSHSHIIVHYF